MSQNTTAEQQSTAPEASFTAIVRGGPLQAAVDAVAALVEECVVEVGPDGLSVAAQDPATVAMVSLDLPASTFESYESTGAELGVDLERLGDVVGMAGADEPVRLELDAETRTLHVRVGELAYTLGLVDPDAVRSPPERIDLAERYTAAVTLDGREVDNFVRAADMVADHLELGVDEDHLYASADGDTDAVRVEHPADDCGSFDVDGDDPDSLFSVSYLDSVARVVPPDADARVRFGDGEPVEFTFDLAGGSVQYVVAPRIRTN